MLDPRLNHWSVGRSIQYAEEFCVIRRDSNRRRAGF
jgi:hypothetical protein